MLGLGRWMGWLNKERLSDEMSANGENARILVLANQKGGVGKSTTAINLSACLAEEGHRVLVVDLDPQVNATSGLGLAHRDGGKCIYNILIENAPVLEVIRDTAIEGLDVVPATIQLAGAEIELVSAISRETKLKRALEDVTHNYEYIVIDCPPSLGLLTVNALTAGMELVIPIQCEYYALEGVSKLLDTVELVKNNLNPHLRLGGVILTMQDARTKLSEQVIQEVRQYFGKKAFGTVIPRSVRLSEAPSFGQPITV